MFALHHFVPYVTLAREIIRSGALGRVLAVGFKWMLDLPRRRLLSALASAHGEQQRPVNIADLLAG